LERRWAVTVDAQKLQPEFAWQVKFSDEEARTLVNHRLKNVQNSRPPCITIPFSGWFSKANSTVRAVCLSQADNERLKTSSRRMSSLTLSGEKRISAMPGKQTISLRSAQMTRPA